jgi:hypothetical protein
MGEAVDAAIGVMQNDEIPSGPNFATAFFGNDAQHGHRLKRGRGNSTANITDHGSLTGLKAEYFHGIDARIDTADNHRLQRRNDLQVCGKFTAGKGFIALDQGINNVHRNRFFLVKSMSLCV